MVKGAGIVVRKARARKFVESAAVLRFLPFRSYTLRRLVSHKALPIEEHNTVKVHTHKSPYPFGLPAEPDDFDILIFAIFAASEDLMADLKLPIPKSIPTIREAEREELIQLVETMQQSLNCTLERMRLVLRNRLFVECTTPPNLSLDTSTCTLSVNTIPKHLFEHTLSIVISEQLPTEASADAIGNLYKGLLYFQRIGTKPIPGSKDATILCENEKTID